MKKLLIPALLLGAAFTINPAQAETMKGKVVSRQNNTLQIQKEGTDTPTTLKTNSNTNYYMKKKIKKDRMMKERGSVPEVDEIVEIVYTVNPDTNELIIDELVMLID